MIEAAKQVNNNTYAKKVLTKSMIVPCDFESNNKEHHEDIMKI